MTGPSDGTGMAGKSALPSRLPTLGERLSWITGKVDPIVASGMDQFKNAAMSIEDIENALRPLFAEAGVVALWGRVSEETYKDGNQTLWKVVLHVTLERDDDPSDKRESDWSDVGGSPSAAHSFIVKGYYRRLFHLADAKDEAGQVAAPTKPKNVQQAVKQIAQTYGDPVQQAPGAISSQSTGKETDPTPASVELTPELVWLNDTLPKGWAKLYLEQEFRKGEAHLRRRLVTEHNLQCGAACEHLAPAVAAK